MNVRDISRLTEKTRLSFPNQGILSENDGFASKVLRLEVENL